jgi:TRAP-type C4-dicarboxylate transport system permease small subunit
LQAFIRIVDAVSRMAGLVAMVLLAAAMLVVCEMILVRYVFAASTVWQTEFVVYSIMAATFIGSPYVLLHRGHVGVDLVPNALPAGPRLVLAIVAGCLSLAFCMALGWSSWLYFHEALANGWTTATVWALPLWIPLLPLPLGMLLLTLQYIAELMKLRVGAEPPL